MPTQRALEIGRHIYDRMLAARGGCRCRGECTCRGTSRFRRSKPPAGSGPYGDFDAKRGKAADLVALPPIIQGTNCENCSHFNPSGDGLFVTGSDGYCDHDKIRMHVNSMWCCNFWSRHDAPLARPREVPPSHVGRYAAREGERGRPSRYVRHDVRSRTRPGESYIQAGNVHTGAKADPDDCGHEAAGTRGSTGRKTESTGGNFTPGNTCRTYRERKREAHHTRHLRVPEGQPKSHAAREKAAAEKRAKLAEWREGRHGRHEERHKKRHAESREGRIQRAQEGLARARREKSEREAEKARIREQREARKERGRQSSTEKEARNVPRRVSHETSLAERISEGKRRPEEEAGRHAEEGEELEARLRASEWQSAYQESRQEALRRKAEAERAEAAKRKESVGGWRPSQRRYRSSRHRSRYTAAGDCGHDDDGDFSLKNTCASRDGGRRERATPGRRKGQTSAKGQGGFELEHPEPEGRHEGEFELGGWQEESPHEGSPRKSGQSELPPGPSLEREPSESDYQVESAIIDLADGEMNKRVRLADLREKLLGMSDRELDEALLRAEREGRLSLYPLDNPLEVRSRDRRAVLRTPTGDERHIVYLGERLPKGVGGFSLKQESASGHKSFHPEDLGKGRQGKLFDMKKGDLPGQMSLLEQVGSTHTGKVKGLEVPEKKETPESHRHRDSGSELKLRRRLAELESMVRGTSPSRERDSLIAERDEIRSALKSRHRSYRHIHRYARAGDPDDCGHRPVSGHFAPKNTCQLRGRGAAPPATGGGRPTSEGIGGGSPLRPGSSAAVRQPLGRQEMVKSSSGRWVPSVRGPKVRPSEEDEYYRSLREQERMEQSPSRRPPSEEPLRPRKNGGRQQLGRDIRSAREAGMLYSSDPGFDRKLRKRLGVIDSVLDYDRRHANIYTDYERGKLNRERQEILDTLGHARNGETSHPSGFTREHRRDLLNKAMERVAEGRGEVSPSRVPDPGREAAGEERVEVEPPHPSGFTRDERQELLRKALERGRGRRSRTAERLKGFRSEEVRRRHPEKYAKPGDVVDMNTSSIHVDPERFQFKGGHAAGTGSVGSLAGAGAFNPKLAGAITVWRDPANGKVYVINGHNRLDLARRMGVGKIRTEFIDAKDEREARASGAITNIAEGRGTSLDAAKFFRDTEMNRDDAQKIGITLREKVASEGLDLAGLDDGLFKKVVKGDITPARGAIVGGSGLSPVQQRTIYEQLRKLGKRGDVNDRTLRELMDNARHAGSIRKEERDLFGTTVQEQSLAIQRSQVQADIKDALMKDKNLFKLVSKSKSAQALAERGRSHIDVEETAKVGQEAATLLGVFDSLKNRTGPVADALNRASEELARGRPRSTVVKETREAIARAIEGFFGGPEAQVA